MRAIFNSNSDRTPEIIMYTKQNYNYNYVLSVKNKLIYFHCRSEEIFLGRSNYTCSSAVTMKTVVF